MDQQRLDYNTTDTVRTLVTGVLQKRSQEWKQKGADAAKNGDNRAAGQYDDWAFAADICRWDIMNAVADAILSPIESD